MTRESFIFNGGYRPNEEVIEDLDFTMRYYSSQYKVAGLLDENVYFYEDPVNNPQASLTNQDIFLFVKRFAASLICEWCRNNGLIDPLVQGKSLNQILAMKKIIPFKDKCTIYSYLDYYKKMITAINNTKYRESKRFVLGLVSSNFLEGVIIYKVTKQIIKKNI